MNQMNNTSLSSIGVILPVISIKEKKLLKYTINHMLNPSFPAFWIDSQILVHEGLGHSSTSDIDTVTASTTYKRTDFGLLTREVGVKDEIQF